MWNTSWHLWLEGCSCRQRWISVLAQYAQENSALTPSNHQPWQEQIDRWCMGRGHRENKCCFSFVFPPRFILVDLWLFSFPDTSTWLSNSYSASQHATSHCTRSRNCIYEFLAKNCEFGVTVTYLILFSIFLDKYMYSFPDVSSKDFRDPCCSVPNFTAFIMVNSNHLLDPTNVPSLGHPPPGAWQPSFSKHM